MHLGAGKTEKAIIRAERAIGTISPVLLQFGEDNKVSRVSGVQREAKYTKDVEIVWRIFYAKKVRKKLKRG